MTKTWDQIEELQPVVLKMLKNSLSKERLAHAYLFEGLKGTGKKDTGMLLAKSLFCNAPINDYVPCETCNNCKRINHFNHPDVHLVEPDGQSIKKQQIRSLQGEFSKRGVESSRKVYIIVHADRMTTNAANSLLKFLEEPHMDTTAILLTEQSQRMLPTILSRCQTISFQPIAAKFLVQQFVDYGVKEKYAPLLAQITHNLDGALAYSNDDWFVQAQKIVLKLYEVLKKNPLQAMVTLQEEWFPHFKEKEHQDLGLDLLLLLLKDLLYIQLDKSDRLAYTHELSWLEQHALHTSNRKLTEQMSAVLDAKRKLQANMNAQLLMEQLVLKMQEGSSFV